MIQRIQSLYLMLAALALAACLLYPVATFTATNAEVGSKIDENTMTVDSQLRLLPQSNPDMFNEIEEGLPQVHMSQEGFIHTWPLIATVALSLILSLVSIFLYKNRMRQVRVVACAFLVAVVYLFLVFVWAVDSYTDQFTFFSNTLGCAFVKVRYAIATWTPIAAVVFLFLAQRAIKKDEAKVRAADRLR